LRLTSNINIRSLHTAHKLVQTLYQQVVSGYMLLPAMKEQYLYTLQL